MSKELADIQVEESLKLITNLKPIEWPENPKYKVGYGPNPNFHDSGLGELKGVALKKREE